MDKALDFYPLVLLRNAHTGGNSRERRDIRPDDRSKLKHHAWDVGGLRFTSTTTSLAFAEGRQRISNVEHTRAARAQYVVTTVPLETQHGLPSSLLALYLFRQFSAPRTTSRNAAQQRHSLLPRRKPNSHKLHYETVSRALSTTP